MVLSRLCFVKHLRKHFVERGNEEEGDALFLNSMAFYGKMTHRGGEKNAFLGGESVRHDSRKQHIALVFLRYVCREML